MSLEAKKKILIGYFRAHGGIPKGAVTVDSDTATVGNVFVNGTWFGTFDYEGKRFVTEAE